ncbi:MAG: hypothetical protein QGG36_12505 [Pirellulaceae bacterium]|jgi:hypothetical protein|nr:hypothetical protein [Pirellulaceae bacterium]
MHPWNLHATNASAFIAGSLTSTFGIVYELASYRLAWNAGERSLFFWPYAVFGFFAPAIFLVIGTHYLTAAQRTWPMVRQVWFRMMLWFLAASTTVLLCKCVVTLYGVFAAR